MNRRVFLAALLPAAVGAAGLIKLLPSEIWTPARSYFLPPRDGWGVNSLGGYMYSRELSNILRMSIQPLTRLKEPEGIHLPGSQRWNVYALE